jgi:protocatechuate 3,4-dioxygenase beta subunit
VENVYVALAEAGVWSVQVAGYNVPNGPQPFALVVDGVDGGATVNQPPSASLVAPGEGATVSGSVTIQIDAADTEDADDSLTVVWNVDGGSWSTATYNNSSGLYEATWDTTGETEGLHTVNAQVTDAGPATATDAHRVTVDNVEDPVPVDFHVGDLDASSAPANGGSWNATVSITVHDANEVPLANATVNGSWTNGTNGSDSCITGADGTCSITRGVRNRYASADFTVTSVTSASGGYDAGANHDPDATDSDGTTITVPQDSGGTEPPTGTDPVHVGELDGTATAGDRGGRWNADVVVTVHDGSEGPVSNVTVSGSWDAGGGGSCTTNGSGQCTVTKNNLKSNVGSVTFTVSDITDTGGTYVYSSGSNHDPDGDSNGTSIQLSQL